MREILSSAIAASSSSPLPWPTVNNEKPKGFSLFLYYTEIRLYVGNRKQASTQTGTDKALLHFQNSLHTNRQVQRMQKVFALFRSQGLSKLLVDDQPLLIPSFLSPFISWTSYSLPIAHISYSHSFNEACTQTSSTRSSLFYESTSSSLLSLYVVYPSLFPPYL